MTRKRCTCAGVAPGYPQHEHWCGKPEPERTFEQREIDDMLRADPVGDYRIKITNNTIATSADTKWLHLDWQQVMAIRDIFSEGWEGPMSWCEEMLHDTVQCGNRPAGLSLDSTILCREHLDRYYALVEQAAREGEEE